MNKDAVVFVSSIVAVFGIGIPMGILSMYYARDVAHVEPSKSSSSYLF